MKQSLRLQHYKPMQNLINIPQPLMYAYHATTLLNAACFGQNLKLAHDLLKLGADPNAVDPSGWCPLTYAACVNNLSLVCILLQFGADPNKSNHYQSTALIYAVYHGNEPMTFLLLHYAANPNLCNHKSANPLLIAARHGKLTLLELLLKNGANPNLVDSAQNSALIWACRGGHKQLVISLLNAGALINSTNRKDQSALSTAIYSAQTSLVSVLLNFGANFSPYLTMQLFPTFNKDIQRYLLDYYLYEIIENSLSHPKLLQSNKTIIAMKQVITSSQEVAQKLVVLVQLAKRTQETKTSSSCFCFFKSRKPNLTEAYLHRISELGIAQYSLAEGFHFNQQIQALLQDPEVAIAEENSAYSALTNRNQ